MKAILGKKIGMSQIISEAGHRVPVTVLEAGPCLVTNLRNEQKNGYTAIQIGFGEVKEKHVSKAYKANFDKNKLPLRKVLREIRVSSEEKYELGQEIKADIFNVGDRVDVQGTSIGKGFAGGMKKWHWRGGPGSHGSNFHRRIGSVGASSFPSRTWPGHHMPGRMGNKKITVLNLEVIRVDAAKNLILVKGAVPGGSDNLVFIRKALKYVAPTRKAQAAAKQSDDKKNPIKNKKK